MSLFLKSSCVSPVELTLWQERGVEGWARNKFTRSRESLALRKSFNTLCICILYVCKYYVLVETFMSGVEKWSEKQNISAYILIRNENQVIFLNLTNKSTFQLKRMHCWVTFKFAKCNDYFLGNNKTYLKSAISILEDAERKRLNQTIVSYYSYRGDILVYLKYFLDDPF